jgi:cell division protein FtsZ
MAEVKPEIETFARIKVVGVGGSGGNVIGRMMECKLRGVEFVAVNCDAQDLHHSKANEKIHIGKNLTKGLGAGMNPEIGRQAAEENRDEIAEILKGSDMVFVTCGLGGGTGTGASPIVAEVAKEAGALTIAVVTKPFSFEGAQRKAIALEGLENLKERVDALIVISNDRLLQIIDRKTTLLNAFRIVDDVLRQGVQGISDLITKPGIVNVDFADVKTVLQDAGSALMGIGTASGENRATQAAKMAINSPLLEFSIDGAKGILFNVSGGPDMTMLEINEAANVITESVDPNAKVIFGATIDESTKKGELHLTVIAAGFDSEMVSELAEIPSLAGKEAAKSIIEEAPATLAGVPASVEEKPKFIIEEKVSPKPKRQISFESKVSSIGEDEDEELEIPAFIRRKMKK